MWMVDAADGRFTTELCVWEINPPCWIVSTFSDNDDFIGHFYYLRSVIKEYFYFPLMIWLIVMSLMTIVFIKTLIKFL